MPGKPIINLVGNRYGRLVVLSMERRNGTTFCFCKCDCKNEKEIHSGKLKNGHTQSCGCLQKEKASSANKTHGQGGTVNRYPLYSKWLGIKRRCYNKKDINYKNYGGRGIKMFKKWKESYKIFRDYLLSLPNCPKNIEITGTDFNRSIDRINNNEDYRPGNIKWSTSVEQANNKTSNNYIIFRKKKMTLAQAVNLYGKVSYSTIRTRIYQLGWPVEKAIITPSIRG